MIEVTVNIPALDRFCDLLAAGASMPTGVAKTDKPAPTPKADKPAPKADKPAPAPETSSEPQGGGMPTLDDAKAAMKTYLDKNDREALIDLLGRFGVRNISALPEEQYPAFITACLE